VPRTPASPTEAGNQAGMMRTIRGRRWGSKPKLRLYGHVGPRGVCQQYESAGFQQAQRAPHQNAEPRGSPFLAGCSAVPYFGAGNGDAQEATPPRPPAVSHRTAWHHQIGRPHCRSSSCSCPGSAPGNAERGRAARRPRRPQRAVGRTFHSKPAAVQRQVVDPSPVTAARFDLSGDPRP